MKGPIPRKIKTTAFDLAALSTDLSKVTAAVSAVTTAVNTCKALLAAIIAEQPLPSVVDLVLDQMGVNPAAAPPLQAYVVLSWQAPPGVPAGTMYQSYYRKAGMQADGVTPYPWNGVDAGSPTSFTFGAATGTASAPLLAPGVTYEFAISTVSNGNLGNESSWTVIALTMPTA